MALQQIDGDMVISGQLVAKSIIMPAGTVTDAGVSAGANIATNKLQHEHRKQYEQEATANNANETKVVFVARFAGNAVDFKVGLVVPPDTLAGSGGRTVTIDFKKNGTTILSAPITLNSTNTAYVAVAGTIVTAPYAAGDAFSVVVANAGGSTGTFPKGVFAQAAFNEAGQ